MLHCKLNSVCWVYYSCVSNCDMLCKVDVSSTLRNMLPQLQHAGQTLFNVQCNITARQVERKCCLYYSAFRFSWHVWRNRNKVASIIICNNNKNLCGGSSRQIEWFSWRSSHLLLSGTYPMANDLENVWQQLT